VVADTEQISCRRAILRFYLGSAERRTNSSSLEELFPLFALKTCSAHIEAVTALDWEASIESEILFCASDSLIPM
jgi:hypothetical protein